VVKVTRTCSREERYAERLKDVEELSLVIGIPEKPEKAKKKEKKSEIAIQPIE
jgi:hypothetical protein